MKATDSTVGEFAVKSNRKQKKRKRIFRLFNFLRKTSIHGFNYIAHLFDPPPYF